MRGARGEVYWPGFGDPFVVDIPLSWFNLDVERCCNVGLSLTAMLYLLLLAVMGAGLPTRLGGVLAPFPPLRLVLDCERSGGDCVALPSMELRVEEDLFCGNS